MDGVACRNAGTTGAAMIDAALRDGAIPGGAAQRDAGTGVVVRTLGSTEYVACWRAMQAFTDARDRDTADEIWLTEHGSVFTLGLAGRREHVHDAGGIPVLPVDRGGQVTYHGPGQLVAYLMFDLTRRRLGIRAMVRAIEAAVIDFSASLGVDAYGRHDAPGVYVRRDGRERKLAALGLRVRRGCTYHGLALNVDMDLAPFRGIDPCGHRGLEVTSLALLGVGIDVARAGRALAPMIASRIRAAGGRDVREGAR